MPTYYEQQRTRQPIFAEDAGIDWNALKTQQREDAQLAQEQIRRGGDIAARGYQQLGEDMREAVQAPMQGYAAYQQAQDRSQRQQMLSEESKERQLRIGQMEQQAALDKQFAAKERETGLRTAETGLKGAETQTALAQQQMERGKMDLDLQAKLHEPGSALAQYGNDPEMRRFITDPKMSVADLREKSANKMAFTQLRALDQQFQQAAQQFPMQLKQISANIAALQNAATVEQYRFGREKVENQVKDLASVLSSREAQAKRAMASRAEQMKGQTPEDVQAQVDQAGRDAVQAELAKIQDPQMRAMLETEFTTKKAMAELQNAVTLQTRDPVAFAQKEFQTEEYKTALRNANAVTQLMALRKTYLDSAGNGLLLDTGTANSARQKMAEIAMQLGDETMANRIMSPKMNFSTAKSEIDTFIASLAGQARYVASKDANNPQINRLVQSLDKSLLILGVIPTNERGMATPDGLASITNKGGTKAPAPMQGPLGPTMPAQNNRPVVSGRRQ